MAARGKRYRAALETLGGGNGGGRTAPEALRLVKEGASAKFDERIDVAIRLGVDPRQGDQMVRGSAVLPHGSGKAPRVVAFAKGEAARAAEEAGAEVVGAEDLVARIEGGWKEFDILVATREMMRLVGRLGKKLGPRMPNPKAGTVSDDLGKTIRDLKAGRVEFRVDKGGVIHASLGSCSFSLEQLTENFAALISAILRVRPSGAKGQFLRKIFLSSSMGPSVEVDPAEAQAAAEKA
jgi:large subunit ribosomal protein L1